MLTTLGNSGCGREIIIIILVLIFSRRHAAVPPGQQAESSSDDQSRGPEGETDHCQEDEALLPQLSAGPAGGGRTEHRVRSFTFT